MFTIFALIAVEDLILWLPSTNATMISNLACTKLAVPMALVILNRRYANQTLIAFMRLCIQREARLLTRRPKRSTVTAGVTADE